MDRWTDGQMDGRTDIFVCVPPLSPSGATVIQSIYTDQFLFLCARVTKLVWYVAVSVGHCVRELAKLTFFLSRIVLSILPPLQLIQSKNSNGRGLSRASDSQAEKYISAMQDA